MPGIAREGLDAAGGTQRAGGQGSVHANGARVVVLGDPSPATASRRAPRP